jgi:hypothetical protein
MQMSERDLNDLAVSIREAIRKELRVASLGMLFHALDVTRAGGLLCMTVAAFLAFHWTRR